MILISSFPLSPTRIERERATLSLYPPVGEEVEPLELSDFVEEILVVSIDGRSFPPSLKFITSRKYLILFILLLDVPPLRG